MSLILSIIFGRAWFFNILSVTLFNSDFVYGLTCADAKNRNELIVVLVDMKELFDMSFENI